MTILERLAEYGAKRAAMTPRERIVDDLTADAVWFRHNKLTADEAAQVERLIEQIDDIIFEHGV